MGSGFVAYSQMTPQLVHGGRVLLLASPVAAAATALRRPRRVKAFTAPAPTTRRLATRVSALALVVASFLGTSATVAAASPAAHNNVSDPGITQVV
jgi:hypothetical protein